MQSHVDADRWEISVEKNISKTIQESTEDTGVYVEIYTPRTILSCKNLEQEEKIAYLRLSRAEHEERTDLGVEITVGTTYSTAELKAAISKHAPKSLSLSNEKVSFIISNPIEAGSNIADIFKALDFLSRFSMQMKKYIIEVLHPHATAEKKRELNKIYFNENLKRPFFAVSTNRAVEYSNRDQPLSLSSMRSLSSCK